MQVASKKYEKDYLRNLHNEVKNLTIIAMEYKYYMTEGDYKKLLCYREKYMDKDELSPYCQNEVSGGSKKK